MVQINADHHWELLAEWLPRLEQDPRQVTRADLLAGGASGSFVLRLHGLAAPCVLKLTLAGSPPDARQRAQREIEFYRSLAGQLPLRLPHMLASAIDAASGASALLLAAYAAPLAPADWRLVDYLEFAQQLARLHAAYWNDAAALAAGRRWLRPLPAISPADVRAALAAWQAIWNLPPNAGLFPMDRRHRFENWLGQIEAQPLLVTSLPLTLCHNDCHMANLLRDEAGQWVWADWQEVGAGHGPEDLSFFFQRAAAAGATIPFDETVAAYCDDLAALTGTPLPAEDILRHMAAFELRTRLVHWPAYLAHSPLEQLQAQIERIEALADQGRVLPF